MRLRDDSSEGLEGPEVTLGLQDVSLLKDKITTLAVRAENINVLLDATMTEWFRKLDLPILRSLCLTVVHSAYVLTFAEVPKIALGAAQLPHVTELTLDGVCVPWDTPLFSQLTTLTLANYPSFDPFSAASSFRRALETWTSLRTLRISRYLAAFAPESVPRPSSLPQITHLSLNDIPSRIASFLEHVSLPNATDTLLSNPSTFEAPIFDPKRPSLSTLLGPNTDALTFFQTAAKRLSITVTAEGLCMVQASSSDGSRRVQLRRTFDLSRHSPKTKVNAQSDLLNDSLASCTAALKPLIESRSDAVGMDVDGAASPPSFSTSTIEELVITGPLSAELAPDVVMNLVEALPYVHSLALFDTARSAELPAVLDSVLSWEQLPDLRHLVINGMSAYDKSQPIKTLIVALQGRKRMGIVPLETLTVVFDELPHATLEEYAKKMEKGLEEAKLDFATKIRHLFSRFVDSADVSFKG